MVIILTFLGALTFFACMMFIRQKKPANYFSYTHGNYLCGLNSFDDTKLQSPFWNAKSYDNNHQADLLCFKFLNAPGNLSTGW